MSRQYDTEYQALRSGGDETEDEQDTPPVDNIITQIRPDQNRSQWNHIEDLDEFFIQSYQYYQRNGFMLMILEDILLLIQFAFVTLFGAFLTTCVNYEELFRNKTESITYADAIYPVEQWSQEVNPMVVICLVVACLVFAFRLIQFLVNLFKYYRMRSFFVYAMKITTNDMSNMTWHEVQRRLLEVQRELQMCIHKSELSELDIYHRMLRFKNYMVAMANKNLLPVKFDVPFLGECAFLSTGLKYNFEMILFWGPWSPFQNNWELKSDYKSIHKRKELASSLSRKILWIGIANCLLFPVIFLWQIIYSFFRYAELAKREPGALGSRMWSPYAKLFLRHFNELDHEFNARLSRAYRPSEKYMNSFISPFLSLVSKHLAFIAGSLLAVMIVLTLIDEDMLHVAHVLAAMTLLGVTITVCRVFIPDEHMVFMPEMLMRMILAQIHYIPDSWKGCAATFRVRSEFAQLFQYKMVYVLEELLSPLFTPFILIFSLRHRAQDIVDFYRNFTVEVTGVGDVCSFAQMDVRRHGHPEWTTAAPPRESDRDVRRSRNHQAEHGKTELSLMHFTLTNPEWRPPEAESTFMSTLRMQAQRDVSMMSMLPADNPLLTSSNSLSMMGHHGSLLPGMSSLAPVPFQSIPPTAPLNGTAGGVTTPTSGGIGPAKSTHFIEPLASPPPPSYVRGVGMRNLDLPLGSSGGFLSGLYQQQSPPFCTPPEAAPMGGVSSVSGSAGIGLHMSRAGFDEGTLEFLSTEMSFGALYMHDYHAWKKMHPHATNPEDEAERRLWSSTTSSPAPGSLSGEASNEREEDMTVGFQLSSRNSAAGIAFAAFPSLGPIPRMPNIQEGPEEEEEGGRSNVVVATMEGGNINNAGSETDFLLMGDKYGSTDQRT